MCRTPEDGLGFPWLICCDGEREKALTIGLERQRQLSWREKEMSVPLSTDEEKWSCPAAKARSEIGVEGECQGEWHDKRRKKFWREQSWFVAQSTGSFAGTCRSINQSPSLPPTQPPSTTRMAPAPASLKPIQPYLTKANEMKSADPVVAYYCSSPSHRLNADSAKATTGPCSMLFR